MLKQPDKQFRYVKGYGFALIKQAKNLKVGDQKLWNGGRTTTIMKILKETDYFITFQVKHDISGRILEWPYVPKENWISCKKD